MLPFTKNHLFAVEAYFQRSLVLSFAVPQEQIKRLIPVCLQLDTFQNNWAFIAVAMVQTKNLRPKGFPKGLGNDFFLIGYRVFVRYKNSAGKTLRGLYILKSETDKRKMEVLGNLFTHYNYNFTDVSQTEQDGMVKISSSQSDFAIQVEKGSSDDISLPDKSPFSNWKEARRFAGPLPFTFTYNTANRKVLIVEGVRKNWNPQPVRVHSCHFSFIESMGLSGVRLANAFIVQDVSYYWKKGRIELWEN